MITRTLMAGVVAVALAAGGYLVGAARAVAPASAVCPPAPATASSLTAGQVRAILREELAAHGVPRAPDTHAAAAGEPTPTPTPSPEPPPQASPENQAAAARAQAILDAAIARGRWAPADREALRQSLAVMPREDAEVCLSAFHVALNDGRLRYDGDGLAPL